MTTNPFNLVDAVHGWILSRPHQAVRASLTQGGWERWAQLDIGFFIEQQFMTHGGHAVTVIFEDHVYVKSASRDDITIPDLRPNFEPTITELKCYNCWSETFKAYAARWVTDYQKVSVLNNLDAHHQHSPRWAFGLANADKVVEWLRQNVQADHDANPITRQNYIRYVQRMFAVDIHHDETNDMLVSWWQSP